VFEARRARKEACYTRQGGLELEEGESWNNEKTTTSDRDEGHADEKPAETDSPTWGGRDNPNPKNAIR